MRIRKKQESVGVTGTVVDTLDITGENYVPNINVVKNINSYSSEEQFIGYYKDKKLYRKVITIGALPNNATINYPHNISDLDRAIRCDASWYDTGDGRWKFIRRYDNDTTKITFDMNDTNVIVEAIGTNWSTRTRDCEITLEYTKTN